METQNTPGGRLRRHREAAGLQVDDAAYKVRELMGPVLGCSRETIRRMETGAIPEEKWNPVIVVALADIYGVPVIDLSNVVVAALQGAQAVMSRAWDRLSDLPEDQSRCSTEPALQAA